jgi:hypothetical protein
MTLTGERFRFNAVEETAPEEGVRFLGALLPLKFFRQVTMRFLKPSGSKCTPSFAVPLYGESCAVSPSQSPK